MSESSISPKSCPKCGAILPSAATAGLCPRCLMAEAMVPSDPGAEPAEAKKMFAPAELAPYFPQLEILECLGRGGMGVVYKARQKSLNRLVALKLLAPERVNDAGFAGRFQTEAQALAKLNHPAIVTVYDFGQAGGFYFLLMEFVDGMNLRQLLSAGRIAPREALAIVPQICDALQYAHDAGIVHRDIKPENILLDRQGRVKVADFGLAKLIGADGRAGCPEPAADSRHGAVGTPRPTNTTEAGQVMGTPQYMAPEQRDHPSDVDHRADIYSLGVVFYQMLTGELPGKQLEPPSTRMRGIVIDVRLDEVVLRALEKQPARRYQQASEVKTIVETIVMTPSATGIPPKIDRLDAHISTAPRFTSSLLVALLFVPLFFAVQMAVTTAFLFTRTPIYRATAKIMFADKTPQSTAALVANEVEIFKSLTMLRAVEARLRKTPGEIREQLANLSAVRVGDSSVVLLTVDSPSREFARDFANASIEYCVVDAEAHHLEKPVILDPSTVGAEPVYPKKFNGFVSAAFISIVLGIPASLGLAWLIHRRRMRRYQQASEVKTIVETIATPPPIDSAGNVRPARDGEKKKSAWWPRLHFLTRLAILLTLLALVLFLEARWLLPWAGRAKARGAFPVFDVSLHVLLVIGFAGQLVGEILKSKESRRLWRIVLFALSVCCWMVFVVRDVGSWSKNSRLVGVWVPAKLDDSAGERFAALPLWIASVTQQQQVVVMDIVCKFESPPPQLGVQFSGSLVSYPAALTTEVAGVDHFIEPEGYLKLTGPPCSKGKMTYRLGFILPDDATAAKVVEQVSRYHVGKPRGLTLDRYSLTLFELERKSGWNQAGQPVHEIMLGELIWPPPQVNANVRNFPIGKLAFVTSAAATRPGEICVVPRNGTQQKRIQGDEPSFMPDGIHLLCFRQEPMDWKSGDPGTVRNGIYLYDLVKETCIPLLNDPTGSCEQPSCSADGTRIAYVIWPKDRKSSHIWIANADGTGRKQLTTGNYYNWTPRWSPDGRKILFETTQSGKREAYVMDADGQNQTSRTPNAPIAHSGSWSPDGLRIAFMSRSASSNANIFVMNADGSNVQNLSKGTTRDSEPVWSPDGKWIAFTRTSTNPPCPERMDVWIMRSNGTGQQQITHNAPGIWSSSLTWGRTVQSPASGGGR